MKKIALMLLLGIGAAHATVNAVVSVLPEKTFVEAIGGDKVHVTVMVLPGNSPHAYEPKPSQMKEIAKANFYFSIGVEFEEAWLPKFANQNSKMVIVDASKGIKKAAIKAHHHHDEETHADKTHEHRTDEHKDEHQAKGEYEERHHHHGGLDPHIWTTPTNIKIIATNIYQALIAQDAVNSDYYKKNYEAFLNHINETDKEIKTILSHTPKGAKFMVFHPSWGYFAKAYNLTQIAIEAGGKNPKPKQVIHLIKEAKEEQVKAVFTAPEFSQKVAKQIAKEVGVPVVAISPLNPNWSQNLIGLAKAIAK